MMLKRWLEYIIISSRLLGNELNIKNLSGLGCYSTDLLLPRAYFNSDGPNNTYYCNNIKLKLCRKKQKKNLNVFECRAFRGTLNLYITAFYQSQGFLHLLLQFYRPSMWEHLIKFVDLNSIFCNLALQVMNIYVNETKAHFHAE